jgi:hypothetical protein
LPELGRDSSVAAGHFLYPQQNLADDSLEKDREGGGEEEGFVFERKYLLEEPIYEYRG